MPANSVPKADSAVKMRIVMIAMHCQVGSCRVTSPPNTKSHHLQTSGAQQAKAMHSTKAACTTATSSAARTCVRHLVVYSFGSPGRRCCQEQACRGTRWGMTDSQLKQQ
jgi:hypothetical protein